MKQEVYTLPEYWASYLINGDHSGLEDADLNKIEEFLTRCKLHYWNCVSCSEESWYQNANDASSLGGNVLEYTFLKV